jgi:hypothetical protein
VSVDVATFKLSLSRLSRHAFSDYVFELFKHHPEGTFDPAKSLSEAGEDVFFVPYRNSYGGSIHNVYLVHFPPMELFHPRNTLDMADPVLVERLKKVKALYKGRKGKWGMVDPFLDPADALRAIGFVTNIAGVERAVYERTIFPAYKRLMVSCGLTKPGILLGSADSFVDLSPESAFTVFNTFIARQMDGLAISLSQHGAHAEQFVVERNLGAGVLSKAQLPYEPAFTTIAIESRDVLEQFDRLLAGSSPESKLEEFLVAHYGLLFGQSYDRIETQLWLQCPELDVGGKDRRLDLFLRNSVSNDWELFELKRATVRLTRTTRDVPVITRHVVDAMHQVQNYAQLLRQDKVRRHFAQKGIEYFQPRLTIVIGRTPSIPHAQWRWLKDLNENKVVLMTYDELRKELALRIEGRFALLAGLQPKSY